MNPRLSEVPSWHALQAHYEKIKGIQLRQLFVDDPDRGDRFTAEVAGLYLDYSKNRISDETIRLLVRLANERVVADRRDAMFRGEKINITEDRAVLHVVLRALLGASPLLLDRQKKSQLKYDSAMIEKLVAIEQFAKPRSFLIVNFGLTQSDIELVYDWPSPASVRDGLD